ncbi:protein DOWNSTREAM OF FLC-like isoform X1 [Cucurbita pepo subsp. pepo]|uniref:protein DOWNSTREAM OF FLC-like isoform X1 n=1 Tax=Cucurbita pepo subsp. pepo TaxID=3664 RepID=UPI000C9D2E6D|nr:protein DOWNSTREAM OF FLC-like isoform X1 [Cucurbita pepo subsp. pepo]
MKPKLVRKLTLQHQVAGCVLERSAKMKSKPLQKPFIVNGCVYCDTCRCGFETNASTPISGAIVRLECRDRAKWVLKFSKKAITNSEGKYTIPVSYDHKDESCKMVLVSSPHPTCNQPDLGRNSATVILTNNNGLTNNVRYANAMGFFTQRPLALCPSLLKQYLDYDESL